MVVIVDEHPGRRRQRHDRPAGRRATVEGEPVADGLLGLLVARGTGHGQLRRVEVGAVLPAQEFPITRADLVRYAGASGDFNPIHWNERFATEVGLPNVIAHGMFTMASAIRVVTDWAGDPGAVVEYGVRFTRPVVVPDPEGRDARGKGAGRVEAGRTGRSRHHREVGRADGARAGPDHRPGRREPDQPTGGVE